MNINTLTNNSDAWPKELDNILPVPESLHLSGYLPKAPRLGVIGTRRPTNYGRRVVAQLVEPVAALGIPIVSGMAIGIDSLAHHYALEAGGQTVAVLPSSIDLIYPKRHLHLANRITQSGCLISEYPKGTKAEKSYFIARNRIIAALSDVLLVIEAAEKSGTMHTVDFALQLGREVAAVPGPINSAFSKGTNKLIRSGATPITSASDILELFSLQPEQINSLKISGLSDGELTIYKKLQQEAQDFNQLLSNSGLNPTELRVAISGLEIANLLAPTLNGVYALRR